MEDNNKLRAYLFGALILKRDDRPQPLPATEAARSLLAYLLFNHWQLHPRSVLAGVFWPDLPEEEARKELSRALYQVRRVLPNLLQSDVYTISLKPDADIWIDIDAFLTLFKRSYILTPEREVLTSFSITRTESELDTLRQAVQLYRGDLLEGFYDDWVLVEREQLLEKYMRSLEALIEVSKILGRYNEALEYSQCLIHKDPLMESAHREVMRLFMTLQRPEGALRQFEDCRQILKKEFDLDPESETIRLAEEIKKTLSLETQKWERPDNPVYIPPNLQAEKEQLYGHLPLVGRATEHRELLNHMDFTIGGAGCLVLIEGEAGVGKTRLVQEIARDAEWRGLQVMWGYCREDSESTPYGPIAEALQEGLTPLRIEQLIPFDRDWMRFLIPLAPQLKNSLHDAQGPIPLPQEQERLRLACSLVQMLRALGHIKPQVLILEDIHWASEDTLDLLENLIPGLEQSHILVLCTCRSEEVRILPSRWKRISDLNRFDTCQTVSMKGLDNLATGQLIQRILGLSVSAALFEARLFRETRGNPLFILEMLRSLYDDGLLFRDELGRWGTTWDQSTQDYSEIPLPGVVERLILRRLFQLPASTRRCLECAAIIGTQFDHNILQAIVKIDPKSLFSHLRTLQQRQLIEEIPSTYRFNHDKVREVVYKEIDPQQRIILHCTIAQALIDLAPDRLATLAYHYTKGEMWPEAVELNLRAGKQAQDVHANQTAWDNYTLALAILDSQKPFSTDQATRLAFELRSARASLAWMKGDVNQEKEDMLALLNLAEQLDDPESQAKAYIQHADFLCTSQDRYEDACQAAQAAVEIARNHNLMSLEAEGLQRLGMVYHRSDNYSQAEKTLLESTKIWERLPEERVQLAETYIFLAQVYEQSGRVEEAAHQGHRALQLVKDADSPLTQVRVYTLLGRLAFRRNDIPDAIANNQAGLEIARRIGYKHSEAVIFCNLGVDYWAYGDYEKTIQCTLQGLEIYRQMENRRGMVLVCDNLSCIYNEIGKFEESRQMIHQGLELSREIGFALVESALLIDQGRLFFELGDDDQSYNSYQKALQTASHIESHYNCAGAYLGMGIIWLARMSPFQACIHFEQALREFEAAGEDQFATATRSFLAISHFDLGDLEIAERLSRSAIEELESTGSGEYVQDTYLHHHHILRVAGKTEAARQALQKAYQAVQSRLITLPEDWRASFLEKVAINREVMDTWQAFNPRIIQISLPSNRAPTGRSLRQNEWIEVDWTVSDPSDEELLDKIERRQHRLLRLVNQAQAQGAAPTLDDLANVLNVGRATIKRDLASLRKSGFNINTRGKRESRII